MIKVNNYAIEQKHFPDGTLHLELTKEILSSLCSNIVVDWKYENDSELFTLVCIKKHLDENTMRYGIEKIHLIMEYLPHARMDRIKTPSNVFTLKYFCEVINSLNFSQVLILDAHSYVGPALLNRVKNISAQDFIVKAINMVKQQGLDPIMFYPDEGSMKRYTDIVDKPYAFGIKKRDWQTGNILGLDIQNKELIEGKDILIVDDICSRGGTFYYAAKALKAAGANRIYLYVTHLEKTVIEGDLWKEMIENQLIECIFTANPLGDGKFNEKYVRIIK